MKNSKKQNLRRYVTFTFKPGTGGCVNCGSRGGWVPSGFCGGCGDHNGCDVCACVFPDIFAVYSNDLPLEALSTT